MLFSESMPFLKKTRPIPSPMMDHTDQITRPQTCSRDHNRNTANLCLQPIDPASAYNNNQVVLTPNTTSSATSPSWMRKMSFTSKSRSSSIYSNASTSSGRSFFSLRRKKSVLLEPVGESEQEHRPSIWTHNAHGQPRKIFRNAGRDDRGRLRLEFEEYEEIAW